MALPAAMAPCSNPARAGWDAVALGVVPLGTANALQRTSALLNACRSDGQAAYRDSGASAGGPDFFIATARAFRARAISP